MSGIFLIKLLKICPTGFKIVATVTNIYSYMILEKYNYFLTCCNCGLFLNWHTNCINIITNKFKKVFKENVLKNVIKLIGAMAFTICSTSVFALPIVTPLALDSDHFVGVIDTTQGGAGFGSEANEMIAAQVLLDLSIGGATIIDSNIYVANTTLDYSGVLTDFFKMDDGSLNISGFDFAMAKYDGPNAGYILFALGGGSFTLPQYPADFWTLSEQYALSHWTGFNASNNNVPEPGIVGLLAVGLIGMVAVRRRMKV